MKNIAPFMPPQHASQYTLLEITNQNALRFNIASLNAMKILTV